MKQVTTSIIAAAMLCGVGSAHADDDGLGLGLAIKASTLGNGIEIGKSVTDSLNVRLGYNTITRDDDQNIDGVDYQAELDFSSTALYLDWHPFEGTFHLTLGYVNSGNELRATASPAVTPEGIQIGDVFYNQTQNDIGQLDAKVEFGSGPYLGLGWGNVPASGFGFSLELGVVQSGAPDASLAASNLNPAFTQTDIDLLNAELVKEEANAQKELDEFELFPVVALGISYGF